VAASDDPGRIARDAYTYVHLLIIAGIIATAAGDNLLLAEPHDAQHGVGLAIILGGPALFLLGENLFEWRATGSANVKRLAAAGLIIGLVALAPHVSALVLTTVITVLLGALAVWELRASPSLAWASKHRVLGV
jgi:low temperature requirement protein LtrA